MSEPRKCSLLLLLAGLFGFLAVLLGAFGAHGLEKILEPALLQRYHTGVEYQFYHSLALGIVGVWCLTQPSRWLYYAGGAFTLGIILFSGSLYSYAMTGIKAFGMITPFGGMTFLVGWILMMYNVWTTRS